MERFTKHYRSEQARWPAEVAWELAGVVGSGNLEVLVERGGGDREVVFHVETSIDGFLRSWEAVFEDFAHRHAIGGSVVTIHDQGAVPSVVVLRLRQAFDAIVGSGHAD